MSLERLRHPNCRKLNPADVKPQSAFKTGQLYITPDLNTDNVTYILNSLLDNTTEIHNIFIFG